MHKPRKKRHVSEMVVTGSKYDRIIMKTSPWKKLKEISDLMKRSYDSCKHKYSYLKKQKQAAGILPSQSASVMNVSLAQVANSDSVFDNLLSEEDLFPFDDLSLACLNHECLGSCVICRLSPFP